MVMLHHMFSICNKVNFEPKFDLKIFIYLKKKKKKAHQIAILVRKCAIMICFF